MTRARGASLLSWLAAAVVVLFLARVAHTSRVEFDAGAVAERAGDGRSAIVHYRRSARMFAPPFDRSREAIARLFELGAAAERQGDVETALASYRAVRGAILSARSVVPHGRAVRQRADARIAAMMARSSFTTSPSALDVESRERAYLAQLEREPHERVPFVLLASLGFAAFVWASHRLLVSMLATDPTSRRSAWFALASALLCFVVSAYFA